MLTWKQKSPFEGGIKGDDKDIYMKTNTMNLYNFRKAMNHYCKALKYDRILIFVMNSLFLKTLYHHIHKPELSGEESSSRPLQKGNFAYCHLIILNQ